MNNMPSIYEYLKSCVPNDHCRQSRAIDLATLSLAQRPPNMIVDLGCGKGGSIDVFRKYAPDVRWVGVDIAESPEVLQRQRQDAEFITFNGVHLPFEDGAVDFIYSNQVFEHVRYPELLLQEIARVMSPGGVFIGQTSQLEPYHSYSYWNFTVFGFKKICEDAGLDVIELRPGIDGITLMERAYRGRPPEYNQYFAKESPINKEIELNLKDKKCSMQAINIQKLLYAGQFIFKCVIREGMETA